MSSTLLNLLDTILPAAVKWFMEEQIEPNRELFYTPQVAVLSRLLLFRLRVLI
jgi:hypothetical protein